MTPPLRLHVVTGKGGVGKTTVAAALALALASQGKTVLLCEVEGRQGISRLFGVGALGTAEAKLVSGLGPTVKREREGGVSYGLHIDPETALREYLTTFFRLGPAARLLETFGVVEFATSIAPGLSDVLLTGKVYEASKAVRRGKGARSYDAVVLDAPPTGRIGRFLQANAELAGLAKVGPIKSQADKVMATLQSPQTAIHLVTLLEEMSVQETVEAVAELRRANLPVGTVIVNQARPQTLTQAELATAATGQIDATQVAADLQAVGLVPDAALIDTLIGGGVAHAARRAVEVEQRDALAALAMPVAELPQVAGGVDLSTLYRLAALLRQQVINR